MIVHSGSGTADEPVGDKVLAKVNIVERRVMCRGRVCCRQLHTRHGTELGAGQSVRSPGASSSNPVKLYWCYDSKSTSH